MVDRSSHDIKLIKLIIMMLINHLLITFPPKYCKEFVAKTPPSQRSNLGPLDFLMSVLASIIEACYYFIANFMRLNAFSGSL